MCSGPEADSYLRLIDFVYHSTLGLRVIKKKSRLTIVLKVNGVQDVTTKRIMEVWGCRV